MTRHGKNNTSSAVYSYHERNADTKKSGYGTQKERLNKDSIKDFDACSLTLQFCKNPVVTKDGVLFDKEAILQYIVQKKIDIVRKVKEYDRQLKSELKHQSQKIDDEKRSKIDKFIQIEKGVLMNYDDLKKDQKSNSNSYSNQSSSSSSSSKAINNFWIPSNTPSAKETRLEKPDTNGQYDYVILKLIILLKISLLIFSLLSNNW